MGNGSGPGRFASGIYTNSWGYQAQRQFANENLKNQGNSFYGLSVPQYQSTMYYMLSNNGPGAGARIGRAGIQGQTNFNTTQFKLYSSPRSFNYR
jgi:hypothetical protein